MSRVNHHAALSLFPGDFLGVSGGHFRFPWSSVDSAGMNPVPFLLPPFATTVILLDESLRLNGCRLLSESFVVGILSGA